MRYIVRMFKAGVLSDGDLRIGEEGVPQGSICSPVLANIYAHYAIDVWVEDTVRQRCRGKVQLFRYADDCVICCEKEEDAFRIKTALGKRLDRFGLRLNEDKTKLVSFSKRRKRQGTPQGTFDFLGFTFYLGKTRGGKYVPKLKTSRVRFRSKLKKVNDWLRKNRNRDKLRPLWEKFRTKLRGHNQYYGVSHNCEMTSNFFHKAVRLFFKWMNRRNQRKSFNWEKFQRFTERFPLPKPRVIHRLF